MRKKALILTTVSGFLHQFERENVRLLQEEGYEVHYASNFTHPVYTYEKDEYETMGIIPHHIPIEKSPARLHRNGQALKMLIRLLDKEQIQLLHCHTPMGGVLGRLSGKRADHEVKVIYTAHGFHFYEGASRKNWMLYYHAEKYLARYTDVLVTINQEDYENACKFSLKTGGKVYQIPGVGLDCQRFFLQPDRREEQRKKLNLSPDCFCLMTVASLDPEKNQETILRAMALLKDPQIRYLICGDGPEREHLERLTAEWGLTSRVFFLGFQTKIEDLLQAADCFVFPSLREGLGMAALEALACGVPVIAADNRGTREYMKNGENGWICQGTDAVQYAEAVRRLKSQPILQKKMGVCGEKTALKFEKSKTEAIMKQIYRTIQEESGAYGLDTEDQYHHGSVQSKSV